MKEIKSHLEPTLGSKENPIVITNENEYNQVHYDLYYIYSCKNCGHECICKKRSSEKEKVLQRRLLCRKCGLIDTSMKNYGVPSPNLSDNVKEKYKNTCIQRYGVDNPSKSTEIKEKVKSTNLEKYGVEYFTKTPNYKEKVKSTNQRLYGTDWHVTTDDFKRKSKDTCLNKYGVDNAAKAEVFRTKRDNTMLERYGAKFATQSKILRQENLEAWGAELPCMSDTIKEKIRLTNIQKYGNNTYLHSEAYNKMLLEKYDLVAPPRFRYTFNNEYFDSSWELAFYLYYVDKGIGILREPQKFEYIHNDTLHYYFPDFEVNGQLYEIKGDQFFKEDGTMCNPYDHSKDELFEAKHLCAIAHNVIFISEKEIQPYLDYVNQKYGKDFLKSCKIQKSQD